MSLLMLFLAWISMHTKRSESAYDVLIAHWNVLNPKFEYASLNLSEIGLHSSGENGIVIPLERLLFISKRVYEVIYNREEDTHVEDSISHLNRLVSTQDNLSFITFQQIDEMARHLYNPIDQLSQKLKVEKRWERVSIELCVVIGSIKEFSTPIVEYIFNLVYLSFVRSILIRMRIQINLACLQCFWIV